MGGGPGHAGWRFARTLCSHMHSSYTHPADTVRIMQMQHPLALLQPQQWQGSVLAALLSSISCGL